MASAVVNALDSFSTDLTSIMTTVLPYAAVALVAWVGWRMACKTTNRAAGK